MKYEYFFRFEFQLKNKMITFKIVIIFRWKIMNIW